MCILLSYGHVEASLLDFVLDITTTFLALVTQHLRKNPLQGIIAHGAFNGMIAVVADIKSGAKEVARTLGSILVMALQTGNIVLGAQHTGNDELLKGDTLDIKAIVESLTDVLQQQSSTRHQIGNATTETIDMPIGTLTNVDKFLFALLGILTILDRTDTPALCSYNLYTLAVRECLLVIGHREYAMRNCGLNDRHLID